MVSMLIVGALGYSCSAEMNEAMGDMMGPPPTNYYATFGIVDPVANTFTDDGGVVWQIAEMCELATQHPVESQERVLVNYTPIDWTVPSMRLNSITKVITKEVLLLDELNGRQIESLGTSHLNPYNVSISGGYINLSCNTHDKHTTSEAKTHYNLVFDTTNSTPDTALFMLRSNRPNSTECRGEATNTLVWLSFRLPDNFGELYPQHPLYMFNWYPCSVGESELTYGRLQISSDTKYWHKGL